MDAIIIDDVDDSTDDMFNAHMEDSRIIQLDKKLNKNLSSATVVGLARFSREWAQQVIHELNELISKKDYNRWCYEVLNYVATNHPFYGIKNPGYFWVEIDLPQDLITAKQNIPGDFLST